jgi:hypothetical protein
MAGVDSKGVVSIVIVLDFLTCSLKMEEGMERIVQVEIAQIFP